MRKLQDALLVAAMIVVSWSKRGGEVGNSIAGRKKKGKDIIFAIVLETSQSQRVLLLLYVQPTDNILGSVTSIPCQNKLMVDGAQGEIVELYEFVFATIFASSGGEVTCDAVGSSSGMSPSPSVLPAILVSSLLAIGLVFYS